MFCMSLTFKVINKQTNIRYVFCEVHSVCFYIPLNFPLKRNRSQFLQVKKAITYSIYLFYIWNMFTFVLQQYYLLFSHCSFSCWVSQHHSASVYLSPIFSPSPSLTVSSASATLRVPRNIFSATLHVQISKIRQVQSEYKALQSLTERRTGRLMRRVVQDEWMNGMPPGLSK